MNGYRYWVAGLLLCLGTGTLLAQKTKLKGDPATMSSDSVKAQMDEAALRASTLMKNSRDSIKSANLQPPAAVMDTFDAVPKGPGNYSFVKAEEFAAARKRIAESEADLARAAKAIANASQSGGANDKDLEVAAERIRVQTENLAAIATRLDAIETEWKQSRHPGEAKLTPVASPKTPPPPATPSPKGTMTTGDAVIPIPAAPGLSPKGGMTNGAEDAPNPKANPKANPKKQK